MKSTAYISLLVLIFCIVTTSGSSLNKKCKTSNGIIGKCTYLTKCAELNNLLKSAENNIVKMSAGKIIKKEHCGYEDEKPLVCCASSSGVDSNAVKDLLPQDCGRGAINFFPGEVTEFGDHPWLALLEYTDQRGQKVLGCGGSLISDSYVLTSARCLSNPKMQLRSVRLGERNTSTANDCPDDNEFCTQETVSVGIEQPIVHPRSDIGLVRLVKPVRFNTQVSPICLPLKQDESKSYTVSGWGSSFNSQNFNVKRQAKVKNVDISKCQQAGVYIQSSDQICAVAPTEKPCIGDSGGPLMQTEAKADGIRKMTVYGVLSSPYSNSGKCQNGVYTNVYDHLAWIHSQIRP